MNHNDFSNLNFNRPMQRIPARMIWMVGLLVGTGLAWLTLPASLFFLLILILVTALGWAASYGWRSSVRDMAAFLNRLQNL